MGKPIHLCHYMIYGFELYLKKKNSFECSNARFLSDYVYLCMGFILPISSFIIGSLNHINAKGNVENQWFLFASVRYLQFLIL